MIPTRVKDYRMTDHQHRKAQLSNYVITNRKQYIAAVRDINKIYVSRAPNLRRQFARHLNGVPYGLVIMVSDRYLSYSVCHSSDTFTRDLAFFYATQRSKYIDTSQGDWLDNVHEYVKSQALHLVNYVRRTNVD